MPETHSPRLAELTPPYAVVVITHNSATELPQLLKTLRRATPPPQRIVVVDAGSSDDSAALAAAAGADVLARANIGFGAANNDGVELVREPVTLLLNPDIEILDPAVPGRLATLALKVDALHAPRLLNVDGSVQDSAHLRPGTLGGLLPALIPAPLLPTTLKVRAEPWRGGRARSVGWAIAAALAARTDTLRALGPFDRDQFLFYEDLDLGLRAAAAGLATFLHPGLTLRHSGGHATEPAYGGEPHRLLACRRRAVIGTQLGYRALLLDDLSQTLTFTTRAAARLLLARDPRRPLAQLRALLAAVCAGWLDAQPVPSALDTQTG